MRPTERFLRDFHQARPGATAEALGWGRLTSGESSYDHLAALVSPGDRVLDLACGDGHLRAALPEDVSYVGVDLCAADLEQARARFPGIDVRCERAQAMSVGSGSIDKVLCHMALMLMDELDAVLGEVARVLAPGGVFAAIIGGPLDGGDAFSLFAELCGEARERGELEPVRLGDSRLRSVETIAALFAGAGLEAAVDDDWLILDAGIDAVWSSLALTYNVAPMSEATRARVEAELRERAAAITGDDGLVRYRLCLRRIIATTPTPVGEAAGTGG